MDKFVNAGTQAFKLYLNGKNGGSIDGLSHRQFAHPDLFRFV